MVRVDNVSPDFGMGESLLECPAILLHEVRDD